MRRVYRLTRAAGARLSAALFSFLPVMNENMQRRERWILYIPNFFIVTESIFLKTMRRHLCSPPLLFEKLHAIWTCPPSGIFITFGAVTALLPVGTFWRTARNPVLHSSPLFCTFGVVTTLHIAGMSCKTARNLVLHSFPLFCTFVNYDSIH